MKSVLQPSVKTIHTVSITRDAPDCEDCQAANMCRKHKQHSGRVRLGTWSIDVAHGPHDKVVMLVFANASTNAEAVKTLHCVLPASLHADAIKIALIHGLMEVEYFYAIDSIRRVHADRAPYFEAQRTMLQQQQFIKLTTTQGGDSEANGTVERGIRTLKEMSDTAIQSAGLDEDAWAQAMIHSAFVYSREQRWTKKVIKDASNPQWMRPEVRRDAPVWS